MIFHLRRYLRATDTWLRTITRVTGYCSLRCLLLCDMPARKLQFSWPSSGRIMDVHISLSAEIWQVWETITILTEHISFSGNSILASSPWRSKRHIPANAVAAWLQRRHADMVRITA